MPSTLRASNSIYDNEGIVDQGISDSVLGRLGAHHSPSACGLGSDQSFIDSDLPLLFYFHSSSVPETGPVSVIVEDLRIWLFVSWLDCVLIGSL